MNTEVTLNSVFKNTKPGLDKSHSGVEDFLEKNAELAEEVIAEESAELKASQQHMTYDQLEAQRVAALPDICPVCDKRIWNGRWKFRQHVNYHKRLAASADSSFECTEPDCDKTYATKSGLQKHTRTKHPTRAPIVCEAPGCDETFVVWEKYKSHYGKAHAKRYRCEAFLNAEALSKETDPTAHAELYNDFRTCERRFVTAKGRDEHMIREHPFSGLHVQKKRPKLVARVHSKKRYECGKCDSSFALSVDLFIHDKVRHSDTTHVCVVCRDAFKEKSELDRHLKELHADKVTCYECVPCVTMHPKSLYRHKKKGKHVVEQAADKK